MSKQLAKLKAALFFRKFCWEQNCVRCWDCPLTKTKFLPKKWIEKSHNIINFDSLQHQVEITLRKLFLLNKKICTAMILKNKSKVVLKSNQLQKAQNVFVLQQQMTKRKSMQFCPQKITNLEHSKKMLLFSKILARLIVKKKRPKKKSWVNIQL